MLHAVARGCRCADERCQREDEDATTDQSESSHLILLLAGRSCTTAYSAAWNEQPSEVGPDLAIPGHDLWPAGAPARPASGSARRRV
jgi:hypothetical protein